MKSKILVLSILVLFVFSLPVFSAEFSSCGSVTEDSILTADITTSGTCFKIGSMQSNIDIILDCRGHTIDGDGTGNGIGFNLFGGGGVASNIRIKDCIITDFEYGIYIPSTILNNQHLAETSNLILEDVTLTSNTKSGFYSDAKTPKAIFSGVTANNNGGYGIYLFSCGNCKLDDITTNENTENGIKFGRFLIDSKIDDLTANSNDGSAIIAAPDSTIFSYARNIFTDITVNSNDGSGLKLYGFSDSEFIGMTIKNNDKGIHILDFGTVASSSNNVIRNSTIESNTYGIYLEEHVGSNNFYYNNFISNTDQAYDTFADDVVEDWDNSWDNTDLEYGNYWDDYEGLDDGSGGRTAGDGIGDTEIPHPDNGYDNYPLMSQSPYSEGTDWSPTISEIECIVNDDCGEGYECIDNECVEQDECETDSDCGDEYCSEGFCVECTENSHCGTNEQCTNNICVKKAECETDDDCSEGFECKNGVCKEKKDAPSGESSDGSLTVLDDDEEPIESKTFQSVLSGTPIKMTVTKEVMAVLDLLIEIGEDSDIVELTVEEFPASVYDNKLDTAVYKYLKIESSASITTADINFKVMNSWILNQGLTETHIALFHYDEGKRIELDTEFLSKDGVYSYFKATTGSFSLFEIGEKGEEKEVDVEVDETAFDTVDESVAETIQGVKNDNTTTSILIVIVAILLYVGYRLVKANKKKWSVSAKKQVVVKKRKVRKKRKKK